SRLGSHTFSTLHYSVDIYDGLDIGFSSNAGKKKSIPDTSQLKESMDLYEEIVTEEQQNRESSYAELKSRFQAAQNQIKELHRRLEEMEIQNTRLNSENCSLKKNISALFRTARQEVARKDAEIQRLNLWSMKGHHQFHINNVHDRNSSTRPPTSSSLPPPSISLPPPLPTSTVRDPPQENPRKENTTSINQPTGSCVEIRASKASSHCHSKSLSTLHSESDKHKSKHRDEKYQSHKLSQLTDKRHRTSDSNKDCQPHDKTRSHKADKDTGRKHDSSKSKTHLNAEGHHRSDRAKSPPPEISALSSVGTTGSGREHRQGKAKFVTSDSEYSTAHSSKERHNRDKKSFRHRSSDSKHQIKSSSNHNEARFKVSSKDREEEQLKKDYQKKVERRDKDEISRKHKRSSLLETSRGREKQRAKESDQAEGDVCRSKTKQNKYEALERSSIERKTTEKSSVKENTPNKKLCFMETLNLTLSPVKKPTIPMDDSQNGLIVDTVVENQPHDENLQPNVEDMCVIDEVNSSELEAGLEDVAEQTSDIPERTHTSCDDVKNVQKENMSCSKSETGKLLETNSVKTTSAYSQSPDTAQNYKTLHPTPKSAQSSSPTPHKNISQNHGNSTELASDIQVDESGPLETTDTVGFSDTSRNISKQHRSSSSHQENLQNDAEQSVAIIKPFVPKSREKPPKTTEQTNLLVDLAEDGATNSPLRDSPEAEDVPGSSRNQQIHPPVSPQSSQQGPPPLPTTPIQKKEVGYTETGPKETHPVSSTISLESLPQEGLSLPEAIYILTQSSENASDSLATEPSSSTSSEGVSKVSSTTEEMVLPERYSELNFTPKKNFSPGKSNENSVEPSSSVPLLHDEDSMMHTLSNLRRFPDAISPLRSPIRITKRSHLHLHTKPGHVKSLQTDFSNTAVNVNSKKLDINKENKYPGSPANNDMQSMTDRPTDHSSNLCDNEVEEGEIFSESEETSPDSPLPTTKRARLSPPVRSKPNHKTVVKKKSEEWPLASKETSETTGTSTRSPKSRFKTVCPAATKVSFSNIEDIVETFRLVRSEIRKKYMKLHKTFPKKSFYGMMDNFQESFLEFVDGAQFGQICSQAEELKSKLKKLIVSVFSKVSNNGIVKRIFEQQATDLKQKLWDFVDVQVDYLFKDIHTTLKSLCKPTTAQAKNMRPSGNENVSGQPTVKKPECQQKETRSAPTNLSPIKTVVPYRTGLGSRGKDIRITQDKDTNAEPRLVSCPDTQITDLLPPKIVPPTPEKNNMVSLIVSQNGSLLDKTDFEILTEQQTSSLTFNLVRDSQMGEIFKCLLQGSDLLETSCIAGDSMAWSLSTPRKDGERLISITTPTKFDSPSKLLSPNKFDTPSKLITTWSSISPRKISSPRSKDPVPLNPALFDESCLLEVPSENRLMLQSSIPPQKSYSILAEDLAVSLTIPSPLKSDSHLSFLQPSSVRIMSTPDSVISAHISEDALLDGEDASEQDIHLTLDTDNSSCGSSSSMVSVARTTSFVFQPDKPMQALVMEKSNDHFIVKICQAASADVTLTANDSLSETLKEEDGQHSEEDMITTKEGVTLTADESTPGTCQEEDAERSLIVTEDVSGTPEANSRSCDKSRKRKKCQEKSKAKKSRTEKEVERTDAIVFKRDNNESFPAPLSPNSLSAKNVVRKKGEVVIAWTRDEDRAILIELKTKGPSRETFSALSEKLNKPSGQISHRFYQLMKLFKKQEKTDT
uniref:CASP8-associated protein 2 n=1 Tax=Anabas testudineus TaxID=64144 RepID=A0A3Q1IG97_ANATE